VKSYALRERQPVMFLLPPELPLSAADARFTKFTATSVRSPVKNARFFSRIPDNHRIANIWRDIQRRRTSGTSLMLRILRCDIMWKDLSLSLSDLQRLPALRAIQQEGVNFINNILTNYNVQSAYIKQNCRL